MATKGSGDKGQGQEQGGVEIETSRRLSVLGLSFEETMSSNGESSIKMSGNGVDSQDLNESDVDNILRFFASFQRRARRGEGETTNDGRGQVTDESTDTRLRENRT